MAKSNHAKPLVSIGLPVFNGEEYLFQALQSLVEQSYMNIEILISDNASDDATWDIIQSFSALDSRIKPIRQDENIGASANYQFVLREATGDFFMWASHDDIWAKNWVEVLLNEFRPDDVGVRGELRLFDESGILRSLCLKSLRKGDFIRYFFYDESQYKVHYIYSLFRTYSLRSVNRSTLNNIYCPDCFFVFSLLNFGALRCVDATWLEYRVHANNLGKKYSAKWKGWRKILYRIHPLSYYMAYIYFSENRRDKFLIAVLTPLKHIYAQVFFWFRGARELIFGKKFY